MKTLLLKALDNSLQLLKKTRTIKFASIAPYEDDELVNSHYLALWKKYGHAIDYVNFQFYADDKLSVSKFVNHFDHLHSSSYAGGQLLASFISKGNKGLPPNDGFFEACKELKSRGKLGGIFVWCADDSKDYSFRHEQEAQALLAA
ncbi:chitinase 2-like protein [Tanacetum coccineum]